MKLTAYIIDGHEFEIRPAPVERVWMDATGDRFAYRCLPLAIANAHGWEILCSRSFAAGWNGKSDLSAIGLLDDPGVVPLAVSHFGHGILAFHIPCVFRTEPGIGLLVQGPINRPKVAIAPLAAIVETDWTPFTFTMNWKFIRPGTPVRFERGEPICHILATDPRCIGERGNRTAVIGRARLEAAIRGLECEPAQLQCQAQRAGSDERHRKWQKLYH